MTKQETYDYLRAHGVDFEITEHKAVFNMEECADLHLPYRSQRQRTCSSGTTSTPTITSSP